MGPPSDAQTAMQLGWPTVTRMVPPMELLSASQKAMPSGSPMVMLTARLTATRLASQKALP